MATDELIRQVLERIPDPDAPDAIEALLALGDTAGLDPPLTIAETAKRLELSPHTLRYYERIGLVTVGRDASGYRAYDAAALRRLVFLTRMRLSGMPMRDLQHYVALVEQGAATEPERLDMLLEHRDTIRRRIRELTLSLLATEYKIATYGGTCAP